MNADRYRTLGGDGHAQLREKASRFIAYAFPIHDEADFKARVGAIAERHHDSRHVCYAWVLGAPGDRHRANDAGEPSGTAGRPILIRIQGAGITHCAVVVVRYFGGTLLGKAGLVKAYGEAAAMAIADALVIEAVVRDRVHMELGYPELEAVRNTVLANDGEVIATEYGERCKLLVALPASQVGTMMDAWVRQGIRVHRDAPVK